MPAAVPETKLFGDGIRINTTTVPKTGYFENGLAKMTCSKPESVISLEMHSSAEDVRDSDTGAAIRANGFS